jgi:hypothetical protein
MAENNETAITPTEEAQKIHVIQGFPSHVGVVNNHPKRKPYLLLTHSRLACPA